VPSTLPGHDLLPGAHYLHQGGQEAETDDRLGRHSALLQMPDAYFFRSKDALYEAVLARVVARAEKELACAHDRGTDRSPEEAVTSYVNALVGLFGRDQNLVRLIQRGRSRREAAWRSS
jgi:hypothetical protein